MNVDVRKGAALGMRVSSRILVAAATASICGAKAQETIANQTKALLQEPHEYVVGNSSADSVTIVDVGQTQRLEDGTIAAHSYTAFTKVQLVGNKSVSYQDALIQYNCQNGTMLLRNVMNIGEDFSIVGILTVPGNTKSWVAAEKPDLAQTFGYPELCSSSIHVRPRVDKGKSWQTVAASLLRRSPSQ